MGSVRPLRMDVETIDEELDRGAHPEALVRSNRIVHRFPLASRFLHVQHVRFSVITLPPFLPERPVHPLPLYPNPISRRSRTRHDASGSR